MGTVPRELEEAARFHTHLGPYLVIGLRMGRAVTRRLGDRPFSYRMVAHTGRVPPYSCAVDGMQLATPCTTGNGCLIVTDDRLMAVDAVGEKDAVRIALRQEIFDSIENDCSEDDQEAFALRLWEMPDDELFTVSCPQQESSGDAAPGGAGSDPASAERRGSPETSSEGGAR
jgi:formylmethanofuran dehydrogenase subunit E